MIAGELLAFADNPPPSRRHVLERLFIKIMIETYLPFAVKTTSIGSSKTNSRKG